MNRQQGKQGGYAGLEEQISRTLRQQAESVQVTSADAERMKGSVHRKIEEEKRMRRWSAKKVMITAVAVCVFGSITAVAAGRITSSVAHSSHDNDFTYDKLGEMETKLGIVTKAPEAFSNGYRFSTGVPVERSGMDESGNVVESGNDLSLNYKKDGMPDIYISVQKSSMFENEQWAQSFDHNGITVGYRADQYRFVPPNYQITEEEQARVDAGELYVSYGSDEIEDEIIKNVYWEDEGIQYYITAMDSSLGAEDLIQMAGEIIDNK